MPIPPTIAIEFDSCPTTLSAVVPLGKQIDAVALITPQWKNADFAENPHRKLLLILPTDSPLTKAAMPSRKKIEREKRRATHASREALQPPEERIDSIDFDTVTHPLLDQTQLQASKAMREWLHEFSEDVLHRSDSKKHFQGKDSAIPTIAVCRKLLLLLD